MREFFEQERSRFSISICGATVMTEPTDASGDDISLDELLPWVEFGCWTALVLAPILYYVNGPSVSSDQAVVRTGLVIVAALGTAILRVVNWRRGRAEWDVDHH
jgi:hypothetical protein